MEQRDVGDGSGVNHALESCSVSSPPQLVRCVSYALTVHALDMESFVDGIQRLSCLTKQLSSFVRQPTRKDRQPPAAERLPPEILAAIVAYVVHDFENECPANGDNRHRDTLSSCSLVCLFWAEQCRPQIHKSLILRSPADLATLTAVTTHVTGTRLAPLLTLVCALSVEQKLAECPWFHNVYAFARTRLPRAQVRLHVIGPSIPTSRGRTVTRPLSHGLPRAIPARTRECCDLVLENIHFPDGMGIRNLLHDASVTTCCDYGLTFKEVTWAHVDGNDLSASEPLAFRVINQRVDLRITGQCTDIVTLAWTALAWPTLSQGSRTMWIELHPLDSGVMLQFIRSSGLWEDVDRDTLRISTCVQDAPPR
ncbi:hypothetical protein BC835DRAFT_1053360 [Cytidiella melzeri]|nr:hypothetical protein BC835DRAFT_1053360 [Cytidiella melzeri]